jgi:hypothetical protein
MDMNRLVAAGAAAVLVIGTAVALPGAVSATPAPVSSSTILDAAGDPATSVLQGDELTFQTDSPLVTPGTSHQVVSQSFDPARTPVKGIEVPDGSGGTMTVPDVTAPEGYTLEYDEGDGWSTADPYYDGDTNTYPNLVGVRATGTTTTTAYANGIGHIESDAASQPVVVQSFQGSSGGDGWNVFFGSDAAAGRVFNIYHHSGGELGLDCHTVNDGTACWGGAYFTNGYYTSAHSTGFYASASDSVFTFVADQAGRLGFACITDVSTDTPTPCTTPFVALTGDIGASSVFSPSGPGDAVQIGTKLYARGTGSGQNMLCLDLATEEPCTSQPYDIGSPSGDSQFGDNRLLAVGSDVYFETGSVLGCFDSETHALCAGFGEGASLDASAQGPLFYTTDVDGNATQVCAYNVTACWDLTGASGTWPTNLPSEVSSSAVDGWGADLNVGAKFYYLDGDSAACFDFVTGDLCAGYSGATLGGYTYAITVDPTRDWCLWSNSDEGQIVTFDPATGASPCSPPRPTIVFPYTATIPRLSCSEASRVLTWGDVTFTPALGQSVSTARLSVLDSAGNPIAGWQDKTLSVGGTLDLSSLSVADTGIHPSFQVYNTNDSDPSGATAVFAYTGSEPQLCSTVDAVDVQPACPTGVGSGSADFPRAGLAVSFGSRTSIATNGGTAVVENTNDAINGDQLLASQCLATIEGYVYRHRDGTNPVAGMTVSLIDPTDSHTVATTVTDLNGWYTFEDIYPAHYYTSADRISTIQMNVPFQVGDSTSMPDIVLPASAPTLAQLPATVVAGTSKVLLVGAGVPVSVLSVTGPCSVSGATVSFTGAGRCTITVTQGGVALQTFSVRVIVRPTFSRPPAQLPPGTGWHYLLTPGSPAAKSTVTGPCTLSSGRVYAAHAGTCVVKVTQLGVVLRRYTITVVSGIAKPTGALSMHLLSVYFTSNSYTLTPTAKAKLAAAAGTLRGAGTVQVIGFTTASGDIDAGARAATLSHNRALAVANYLKARGVTVSLKDGVSRLGNPAIGAASNRRADVQWA